MSGPIYAMPINDLRLTILELLQKSQQAGDTSMVHLAVSISEYLRDAERWHHVAEHTVQWNNFEPRTTADFRKWIDQEIENERERLVHARKRRQDGVSGNSGTGGAPDPVV